ncbi:Zinc finger BED domain-containing protein 1 [Merluccius polli]|uniref:Zinc finger BED domain-containing protein 1 n=1 Tax=Merluccius polli TaxID=89951 RepID=A0AA47MI92_MERPO|nr:Zinc finger BED domain-containing protein 1 [Merluccius polli]
MVERMLEQAQAIKRVFAQDNSRRPLPQLIWQDISVLESVNNALKPVADFTDILSGEYYVTVSSLLPMLAHLESVLEESDDDSTLTADLKRVILGQMAGRYGDDALQRMMRKATLLDPRDCVAAKPNTSCREGEEPDAGTATAPKKKKWSLGSLLGKRAATAATLTDKQKVASEMSVYLQELSIDGEEDPLTWWKTNEKRFPFMASQARKYLCICATSTPSERVFSAAGSVVTPIRSLLKPEKVNMLVFLARNI